MPADIFFYVEDVYVMKKRRLAIYVFSFVFAVFTVLLIFGRTVVNMADKSNYVYAAESKKDTRTGVYKASYKANGKVTTEWCYLKNGKVQYSYTGFAGNSNGWWYVEKGKVNFEKKDVIKGVVKGESGWWYVKNGMVQFVDSVEMNNFGWWCIQKGKVNFGYTGLAKNNNGWWFCKDGKVDFGKKDVLKGTVNGQNGWWFVSGGKVQFVNTVEKNSNGWWCIQNGKVNFGYTGLAKNNNGWWYIKNGKVQFVNYVVKGTVEGVTAWWYVKNGKYDPDYQGIGSNNNGDWFCSEGKVIFDRSGIEYIRFFNSKEVNNRYLIKNGKVDNGFTGLYEDYTGAKVIDKHDLETTYNVKNMSLNDRIDKGVKSKAYRYIEKGVGINYSGEKKIGNITYILKNGAVIGSYETEKQKELLYTAYSYLCAPYVYGGADKVDGVDCSGLPYAVYKEMGISIPHGSYSQYIEGKNDNRIVKVKDLSELKTGDLLIGGEGDDTIGLYLGAGVTIEARGLITQICYFNPNSFSNIYVLRYID